MIEAHDSKPMESNTFKTGIVLPWHALHNEALRVLCFSATVDRQKAGNFLLHFAARYTVAHA
jgi:hypothetical protein